MWITLNKYFNTIIKLFDYYCCFYFVKYFFINYNNFKLILKYFQLLSLH